MTITIITACCNAASHIQTALESVLRQSWQDIEYLVVDGGSVDGTLDLIHKYEPMFKGRLRWVSEQDRGTYDAFNKGIEMAKGDVIGILNADDVFSGNDVIARMARAFKDSPEVDIVYGDIRFVPNRVSISLEELRRNKTIRYYSAKWWKPWMLQWGFMPPHPSIYIRRECFVRLGNYALDYRIAADYELLIRFMREARMVHKYVPMCFVDMRMGGVSTRNWRSNVLLNQEIVRGNREAGYFCCLGMMFPKYLFKIFEIVLPRVRGTSKHHKCGVQ